MVSLTDIYNIKESTFSELKKDRDPARGNKGKTDAKDYYFVDEPADPETGAVRSKVVYKRSFKKMVADLEAETIDFKKLADDNPNDMVLYNLSEELKDLFNKFRTHVRKKYPEEYKKLEVCFIFIIWQVIKPYLFNHFIISRNGSRFFS